VTSTSSAAPAAATSSRTTPPLVVVGPLTRVGRALADRRDGDVVAVARHDADTRALVGQDVVDVSGDGLEERLAGAASVDVAVCALGPLHPGPLTLDADTAGIDRDLALVRRVLQVAGDRPVRVALVSSVVALAPTADRRYYGGAKALVEQALLAVVAQHSRARLDVLYPGRLLHAAERTRPWHRLHAPYARVAARVEQALADDRPRGLRRVVGLDARVWLLLRSLSLVVSGLRPGHVDPTPELVDTKVAP
jgi:hypothetical protein